MQAEHCLDQSAVHPKIGSSGSVVVIISAKLLVLVLVFSAVRGDVDCRLGDTHVLVGATVARSSGTAIDVSRLFVSSWFASTVSPAFLNSVSLLIAW